MNQKVMLVSELESMTNIKDARIASVRYDLIPWALVLDIDVFVNEAIDSTMKRMWLIFQNINYITLPLDKAQIPTGIIIGNNIIKEANEYHIAIILQTEGNTVVEWREIVIKAKDMICLSSKAAKLPNGYNLLSYEDRNDLCTDEELLLFYNNFIQANQNFYVTFIIKIFYKSCS